MGPIGDSLVDDVAQELWLLVHRKRDELRSDVPIRPFLLAAAERIVMAQARAMFPLEEKRDGNEDGDELSVALAGGSVHSFSHAEQDESQSDGAVASDLGIEIERVERKIDMERAMSALQEMGAFSNLGQPMEMNARQTSATNPSKTDDPGMITVDLSRERDEAKDALSKIGEPERKLRALRESLGWSQAYMAQRLGVSTTLYCSCEYGRSRKTTLALLPTAIHLERTEKEDASPEERDLLAMTPAQLIDHWKAMLGVDRDVSLTQLEKLLPLHKSTLSRWLAGIEKPRPETVLRCEQQLRLALVKTQQMAANILDQAVESQQVARESPFFRAGGIAQPRSHITENDTSQEASNRISL
jgi:transcriptional regulator with XRE-family HTH domain